MYTSFVSMISSVPSIRTIIPLSPAGIEAEGELEDLTRTPTPTLITLIPTLTLTLTSP